MRPLRGCLGTGRPLHGRGAAAARFPAGKDRPLLPPSAAGAEKGKIFPSLFPCVSPVSHVLRGDGLGFGNGVYRCAGAEPLYPPHTPLPRFHGFIHRCWMLEVSDLENMFRSLLSTLFSWPPSPPG